MKKIIPNESHYITALSADHIEGRWWRVTKPLVFYSAKYNKTYTTPPGAVTDFASIPRLPFVYTLFGNTMHWEATLHDIPGYRFGLISRWEADMIFHEAGVVRSKMRSNQGMLHRFGRFIRRNLATATVISLGWGSYKAYPGSLDYQICKGCKKRKEECTQCFNYYPKWEKCVTTGYRPDMEVYHEKR